MVNIPDDNDFYSEESPYRNGATMIGEVKSVDVNNNQVIVVDLDTKKVEFGPLSVVTMGTYRGGSFSLPDVGQVVAWTPYDYQQGIVWGRVVEAGAGKSDADKVFYIVDYEDGKTVKFDKSTNTFTIICAITEINCPDIRLGQSPTEAAALGDTLKTWLEDLTNTLSLAKAGSPATLLVTDPLTKDFATLLSELAGILATQVKVK